jgi:UbiD family decarboxylase
MSLHEFLETQKPKIIEKEADKDKIPLMIKKDQSLILFKKIKGYNYQIVSGVCGSRDKMASWLGTTREKLSFKIADAIQKPRDYNIIDDAQCYEVKGKDLDEIPLMRYCERDGGEYISSGIVISRDPGSKRLNSSFHRMMKIGKNRMAIRLCDRDTFKFCQKYPKDMPVSIFIGHDPSVLIPGAISAGDIDEFKIMSSLRPLEVTRCKTNDLLVPAHSEIIIEGRITKEMIDEGPFVDISGTYDVVRKQPVLEIDGIWHRKDPIYHTLLPGGNEHRLLMGMPREPTIYNEVAKVCSVRAVNISTGGCSWLHCFVSIKKQKPDDGMKALEAAFRGHKSLKHCVVVDDDVDVFNGDEVEWAIATRYQADKQTMTKKEEGSSIDPSTVGQETLPGTDRRLTCKVGIDATIPFGAKRDKFEKAFIVGEKK